jgi:TRAP-type uncharacterized transport system fused permease subunit
MITCMILGMGLPSIPAYLITATIAAPALIQLGIAPIAAHMFVFYYAMFANLTPPVALASFAAAGVSGGDPMETGYQSVKLAIAGFIVPYMFVYNNSLLLINTGWLQAILVLVTSVIGVFMIGVAAEGYLMRRVNPFLRVALLFGAFMLISENVYQDILGLSILAVVIFAEKFLKIKKDKAVV